MVAENQLTPDGCGVGGGVELEGPGAGAENRGGRKQQGSRRVEGGEEVLNVV